MYGMKTNIGNAFVYGDLEAIDTVTYPEIGGSYMYVEKVKEKYTRHTRTVTRTRTVNGKPQSYTTTEVYWTWDRVSSEDMRCKELRFLGVTFNSNKFIIPETRHIDTIKESSHVRYKYYGTDIKFTGTIFAKLGDNTIPDKTEFYKNTTITDLVDRKTSNVGLPIFWTCWLILIIGCVIGFYYIDNRWLE